MAEQNIGVPVLHEELLAPPWQPWMALGRCAEVDPELFFPEAAGPANAPKRVCFSCEVQAECLDYALDHKIMNGVWGGTSGYQRKNILKERGIEVDELDEEEGEAA